MFGNMHAIQGHSFKKVLLGKDLNAENNTVLY